MHVKTPCQQTAEGGAPVGALWTNGGRLEYGALMRWLHAHRGRDFTGFGDLWSWSVTDLEGFWSSVWEFLEVRAHRAPVRALSEPRMPGAQWFPGAELNYAEHALRRRDDHPAVVAGSEARSLITLSYGELYRQTAAVAAALARLGVRQGDRVVAYLPNIPETVVAFLATASLGAVWASLPSGVRLPECHGSFPADCAAGIIRRRRLSVQGPVL